MDMSKRNDILTKVVSGSFVGGIVFFSILHLFFGGPAAFVGLWILLWGAVFGVAVLVSERKK
jgi:hypothetical protein